MKTFQKKGTEYRWHPGIRIMPLYLLLFALLNIVLIELSYKRSVKMRMTDEEKVRP